MSNKTPWANVKKIKWGPELLTGLLLAVVLIFVATSLLINNLHSEQKTTKPAHQARCVFNVPKRNTDKNDVNGLSQSTECLDLELADTDAQRIKGLSDRPPLANNAGMLFVFDQQTRQCFWMKDMRFSLDMIWLDSQKKIVKIEQDVAPSTYPNSFCADTTQYVVELNSGTARQLGLAVGQQVKF